MLHSSLEKRQIAKVVVISPSCPHWPLDFLIETTQTLSPLLVLFGISALTASLAPNKIVNLQQSLSHLLLVLVGSLCQFPLLPKKQVPHTNTISLSC